MLRWIIYIFSTRIIFRFIPKLRKVTDQTFSKEAKKIPTRIREKITDDQTIVSRILVNIDKTYLQLK